MSRYFDEPRLQSEGKTGLMADDSLLDVVGNSVIAPSGYGRPLRLATAHGDVGAGVRYAEEDGIGRAAVRQCQHVVVPGAEVPVARLANPGVWDVEVSVAAHVVTDVVAGGMRDVAAVRASDSDGELLVRRDVDV